MIKLPACNRDVLIFLVFFFPSVISAQTGSVHEPVRYVGGPVVNNNAHDGQLRPAIGVETFQVFRANRTHPEMADQFGWTYNHGPNIVYWNNRFYLEYLSNPVGEHIAPGHTLLTSSADGRTWDSPKVIFPIYELQSPDPRGTTAMMHQRMGFYITPDDRMLVLAFYGHAPNPFGKGGIGRVVRELYKDGKLGPIYFLKYNEKSGWGESNTNYPFYTRSEDKGFVAACESLLANTLMVQQWWDEEFLLDDAFSSDNLKLRQAFNWYHRKDGTLVGLWKWSLAALSKDEGKTWSEIVKVPTLQMTGAKISGRKMSDGRYALVYNPNIDDDHRWPLAIVTGDDGITFDNMLCVHGEVPPRRFIGKYKDFGPQYNRMVEEGNGKTPGTELMGHLQREQGRHLDKAEFQSRFRHQVTKPVEDSFDELKAGGPVTDWNIYSPRWAPVRVENFPSDSNKSLKLSDKDPYDYARAIRVFPETESATIKFKVYPEQNDTGQLDIDITDRFGYRPVRISFDSEGNIVSYKGSQKNNAVHLPEKQMARNHTETSISHAEFYDLSVDGKTLLTGAACTEYVKSIERISFRTGNHRESPTLKTSTSLQGDFTDPNPDEPTSEANFFIDELKVETGG